MALVLGVMVGLVFGNPYMEQTKKITPRLLAISIVGLGAGMNLMVVAQAGIAGLGYTAISIVLTMLAGLAIGVVLRTEREASVLLSVGTAICGGSAIAAVAPAINAKHHNISVALGVVFLLNAVGLLIFPVIGHYFDLSQTQFGLWSALAIHDTSSVVGAGTQYGPEALETGTTVKLARALWIVPLVFIIQAVWSRKYGAGDTAAKRKYPWFILGFLAMAALVTWVPALGPAGEVIVMVARRLLVLTLFLIGASLTRDTLRAVGFRPLVQGVALWVLVAGISLCLIRNGWIG
jgi:uncharacterized integral membrane protein (TIGR00698 family)